MYCVNCGVKLADTEKECPLCGVAAWHPEVTAGAGEPLFPADHYPELEVSPKAVQIIVTTMFLMAVFICLLCDLQICGAVTWSGFVIGALAVFYVIFLLPFWFRKANPVVFTPCNFAAIGLYLLYINLATGGSWFLSFAFPVVGFVGIVCTAVVTLLRYIKRGRLWVFGGAQIALGAFMPLMEYLIYITFDLSRFVGWSLYPMIALVLIGGMLFLLAGSRKAKESMQRRFFI